MLQLEMLKDASYYKDKLTHTHVGNSRLIQFKRNAKYNAEKNVDMYEDTYSCHVHHKNCACIGRLLHITLMLQTFQSLPESDVFAMVKYNFMAHGSYEPPHWYCQFNDNTDV